MLPWRVLRARREGERESSELWSEQNEQFSFLRVVYYRKNRPPTAQSNDESSGSCSLSLSPSRRSQAPTFFFFSSGNVSLPLSPPASFVFFFLYSSIRTPTGTNLIIRLGLLLLT